MKRLLRFVPILVAAGAFIPLSALSAQSLSDSLVARIRAGASNFVLPGDSVDLPMVGTPTLPLVEVNINGIGPFRFLVDLGSNVTIFRRNVVDSSRCKVLVDRPTSDIVHVETIQLGDALFEDVTIASYDELDVDGVLGYNVLQYSAFTLDYPGERLILHRRSLPPPDGRTVFPYRLERRMPYIMLHVGVDSILVNVDTGASEWMTVPPAMQTLLPWLAPPVPGRTTFNNQTGSTRVLEGHLADTLRFGELVIARPLVYVNPDADDAWLGSAAMSSASWTFDPRHKRVQVRSASD